MKTKDIKLEEIREWAKGREFSKEPLQLFTGVKVVDRQKFVWSHIGLLEGVKERGRKTSLTVFWERLKLFYSLVESEARPNKA